MEQAFAETSGAYATELLPVFSSILEVRSHKRTSRQLGFKEPPKMTSRQADLSHAPGDISHHQQAKLERTIRHHLRVDFQSDQDRRH